MAIEARKIEDGGVIDEGQKRSLGLIRDILHGAVGSGAVELGNYLSQYV